MSDSSRRTFFATSLSGLGLLAAPAASQAQGRVPARADSPRIGADPLLISTGLTGRWQSTMRQDLGWTARFEAMGTRQVLNALEQGGIDAGLFLSHPRAEALEKDGLIYNRQTVARTDVLLLGPTDDVAGIRGETDAARALMQVLAACRAGVASWQPLETDSPLEALAHRLSGGQLRALLSVAASTTTGARLPSYRLMTRAQWQATPPQGEPRKIWLAGGPQLMLHAQIACAFRSRHPGAKLLVSWLQWPLAQSAVKASRPAWQGPQG
jgi:tungstate transport system substrate-binding protein